MVSKDLVDKGRIFVSHREGTYVLKLTGDVRMVLCASLSRYIESIFKKGKAQKVLVDLLEATGCDSTTLGLLAKLAIHCNKEFDLMPTLYCTDPGILHTLQVMGLDEVFDIQTTGLNEAMGMEELSCGDEAPEIYKQKVIEAHKILIELNPKNHDEFIDLIRALESD